LKTYAIVFNKQFSTIQNLQFSKIQTAYMTLTVTNK
jgi:hypothetical protein